MLTLNGEKNCLSCFTPFTALEKDDPVVLDRLHILENDAWFVCGATKGMKVAECQEPARYKEHYDHII